MKKTFKYPKSKKTTTTAAKKAVNKLDSYIKSKRRKKSKGKSTGNKVAGARG